MKTLSIQVPSAPTVDARLPTERAIHFAQCLATVPHVTNVRTKLSSVAVVCFDVMEDDQADQVITNIREELRRVGIDTVSMKMNDVLV